MELLVEPCPLPPVVALPYQETDEVLQEGFHLGRLLHNDVVRVLQGGWFNSEIHAWLSN